MSERRIGNIRSAEQQLGQGGMGDVSASRLCYLNHPEFLEVFLLEESNSYDEGLESRAGSLRLGLANFKVARVPGR